MGQIFQLVDWERPVGAHAPDASKTSGFVAAGRRFSFFVLPQTYLVHAMGSNRYGQLGIGDNEDAQTPKWLAFDFVIAAAAGAFHSLFLTRDGVAFAAGRNRFGEFGDGTTNNSSRPVRVCEGVKAVAAGYGHSLFLMVSGAVEAAGWNRHGQLGDGTTTDRSTRVSAFSGNVRITAVAAGYDFSYFLAEDGKVFAVGQNLGGQLGDGTRTTKLEAVPVLGLSGVSHIAAGESHGLFLQEGKVFATGSNANGQLGDRSDVLAIFPQEAQFGVDVRTVAAGVDSSCGASADTGRLFCTGSNLDGQLGLGERQSTNFPRSVPGAYAHDVSIGDSHSVVLQADYGAVLVSGTNRNGELGDGSGEGTKDFKHLDVDITTTKTSTGPPTPAPPTPPPTPAPAPPTTLAPTPEPTPSPTENTTAEPTREPGSDDFEFDPMLMLFIATGVLVAAGMIFVCLNAVLGRPPDAPDSHLELMHARTSNSN